MDEQTVFSACLDLGAFRQPIHRWADSRTVDERRAWFLRLAAPGDDGDYVLGDDPDLLAAMEHCWRVYLERGRTALFGAGERVWVVPELGSGFGVADPRDRPDAR